MEKPADDWSPYSLLLIDVQRDFWDDNMSCSYTDYKNNVERLLVFCRQAKLDVVHLRAAFRRDKSDWMVRYKLTGNTPCLEGSPGAETLSFASEHANEEVISKQTFDGFHNPALHDYLAMHGKQFLLVAGLVTSVCVLLTAASAAQRGYLVSLVTDCCADNPEAHQQTLNGYPFIFGQTKSNQIAANHKEWQQQLGSLLKP